MGRAFFYNRDEFEAQYRDYIQRGLTPVQALRRVQANEEEDRREYEKWAESMAWEEEQ